MPHLSSEAELSSGGSCGIPSCVKVFGMGVVSSPQTGCIWVRKVWHHTVYLFLGLQHMEVYAVGLGHIISQILWIYERLKHQMKNALLILILISISWIQTMSDPLNFYSSSVMSSSVSQSIFSKSKVNSLSQNRFSSDATEVLKMFPMLTGPKLTPGPWSPSNRRFMLGTGQAPKPKQTASGSGEWLDSRKPHVNPNLLFHWGTTGLF